MHRGQKILEKILKANSSNCTDKVKKILKQNFNMNDHCAMIQLGDGFERAIHFTLIGLITNYRLDYSKLFEAFEQVDDPNALKQLAFANSNNKGISIGKMFLERIIQFKKVLPMSEITKLFQNDPYFENSNNLYKTTNDPKIIPNGIKECIQQ